jgi:two-component system, chemotaxis family, protein-glutamate methylesterase/glutaminase
MNIFSSYPSTRDIVVIGASAGGVETLSNLVAQLPENFPAAVFIVMHIPAEYPSQLPQILSRKSKLPIVHPSNGEAIQKGYIYVAPTDHHLLIEREQVRISRGPRENNFRPSIDVLFRSAAWCCGARVTGVILTGVLDDGAAGLFAVKSRGGKAVVQNPNDALYPDMPRNALKIVEVDYCVPIKEMGDLLEDMVNEPVEEKDYPSTKNMELEVKIALEDNAYESGVMDLGELTSYTCPECHGALAQIKEGKLTRFRCHTGHAFSLNTLLVQVTKSIDRSLWDTARTIEESQLLLAHIAGHLQEAEENESAEIVLQKSEEAKERAQTVRKLVLNSEILSQEKLNNDYNRKD